MIIETILLTVLVISIITIAIKQSVNDSIVSIPNIVPLLIIDTINIIPTITNAIDPRIVGILTISEPIYKFKTVGILTNSDTTNQTDDGGTWNS